MLDNDTDRTHKQFFHCFDHWTHVWSTTTSTICKKLIGCICFLYTHVVYNYINKISTIGKNLFLTLLLHYCYAYSLIYLCFSSEKTKQNKRTNLQKKVYILALKRFTSQKTKPPCKMKKGLDTDTNNNNTLSRLHVKCPCSTYP